MAIEQIRSILNRSDVEAILRAATGGTAPGTDDLIVFTDLGWVFRKSGIIEHIAENGSVTLNADNIGKRLRQNSGSSIVTLPPVRSAASEVQLGGWIEASKINAGILSVQIDGGDSGIRIYGGVNSGGNVTSIDLPDGAYARLINLDLASGFWDALCNDQVVATP